MVAFLRKVSALVVAAALILCSSVTAFADAGMPFFTNFRFYVRSPEAYTYTLPVDPSTSYNFPVDSTSISASSNFDITLTSSVFNDGAPYSNYNTYQYSFVLVSPDNISDLSIDYVYLESFFGQGNQLTYSQLTDFEYTLSSSKKHNNTEFYYTISFIFTTKPESTIVLSDLGYMFRISFNKDITVDAVGVSTSYILSDFDPNNTEASLFYVIKEGFNSILSFLKFKDDDSQSDYIAVTDPSTSTEIQETQDMIDSVEGFESQLNSNITTEFNNINFTTPTNLAAPVAYVGDKVTRSINSLGNYQPLIFVPLTLGIMLIFLGRGASSLGALTSRRFERDLAHDLGLDRNKNDERWLW